MAILTKIKHWYTKPRKGWIFGFSDWLLNDKEVVGLLFVTSYTISSALFTFLFLFMLITKNTGILVGIFAFAAAASLYKLITTLKAARRSGGVRKMYPLSLNEFFYGGNKDGNYGYENDEICDEQDAGRDCADNTGVRKSKKKPESDDHSFISLIQEPEDNK